MRMFSALIITLSAMLIVPAAGAALVAPFGFESGVLGLRLLLSVILLLSPILLLLAALGALFALQDRRWIRGAPLSAFATACVANALFWNGF